MMDAGADALWSPVDAGLALMVLISLAIGAWRGFLFEVLNLAGWIVALVLARWLGPELAPELVFMGQHELPRLAMAYAVVFVLSMLIWGLVARLLRMLLHATPLRWPDRAFGALLGGLRGVVWVLVVVAAVSWSPWRDHPRWTNSHGVRSGQWMLAWLQPMWPPGLRSFFERM